MTQKQKILYIEDTADARMLVRRLLSNDYIILEASNPIDGIELARDTHPDLVLLDLNLPQLSGREVATRLHKIMPAVPLVALTADVTPNAREAALVAGCVGFITKPIDIDTFPNQIRAYINGKQEEIHDREKHIIAYQEELVEHLETKVQKLAKIAERNQYLNKQNKYVIAMLGRKQHLLEAGARVSHGVTSILNLEQLLASTVDIITDEFKLYYSGIFLISKDKDWAELRAGYGKSGDTMVAEQHRLRIDNHSMIGKSILQKKALISLDVEGESSHFKNPWLPNTRSEVALPLIAQGETLGAISVQSTRINAFEEADITALQTMADQVAIAINNAQLLQDLKAANAELVRSKTLKAIATATSEAIHWVGNKAAPIPGSAQRVKEDIAHTLALTKHFYDPPPTQEKETPFQGVLENIFEAASQQNINLSALIEKLSEFSPRRLSALLDLNSTLEDLNIIEESAKKILEIKEDLIGPARQRQSVPIDLKTLIPDVIQGMGSPTREMIRFQIADSIPEVNADPHQIRRVLINIIKNASEALRGHKTPQILVCAQKAAEADFVEIYIKDNGPGIPKELQDRIWVSFFTTKSEQGGTGLGLSACMQIIQQSRGKLWVESEAGKGATFFIWLPEV